MKRPEGRGTGILSDPAPWGQASSGRVAFARNAAYSAGTSCEARLDETPADSSRPPGKAGDSTYIAGDSALLVFAGLANFGLRFLVNNWYLSRTLGMSDFGLYTLGITQVATLAALAPLGMDFGIILFAARYLKSGETRKLKGAILTTGFVALASGVLLSAAFFSIARWGGVFESEKSAVFQVVAPAVLLFSLVLYMAGILRGYKDNVAYALNSQIILPTTIFVAVLAAAFLWPGVWGALGAFTFAHVVALAVVIALSWRRVRSLFSDRALRPEWETRKILLYSVPMGVESLLYRLIQQAVDLNMLAWLASMAEVGIYKVAWSLATASAVLVWAVETTLNPVIAELVYVKEMARLQTLLGLVTRWMAIAILPVTLVLFLLPDVVLKLWRPEYVAGIPALYILLFGQVVFVILAPTARLLPMAGYSRVNFLNGLGALILDFFLQRVLIPRWGMVGAATATTLTLVAWSLGRLATMRAILRLNPFTWRLGALTAYAAVAGSAAFVAGEGLSVGARVVVTTITLAGFAGLTWILRTADDAVVFSSFKSRFRRLATRRPNHRG
jgi:O-antigen/teichoic acid export membrane protein